MGSNGFVRKKVGTLTLGEKLKKMRSDRRVTCRDVSKQTGVRAEYLEYLEDAKYHKLPADVYVKGFLRSLASYFGASSEVLIRLYDREKGIQKFRSEEKEKTSIFKKGKFSSFIFTPKSVMITLITLVVFFGFFYLYQEFDSFVSEPELTILEPGQSSSVSVLSTVVEGLTEKDAKVFINGEEVLVDENGKFQEKIELHSGMNTVIVEAENIFSKRRKIEVFVEVITDQTEATEDLEEELVVHEVELKVEDAETWVQVYIDEKQELSDVVEAGRSFTYTVSESIQVSAGNGQAVRVIMDGQDLGTLSEDEGLVRDKTYPLNSFEAAEEGLAE